MKPSACKEHAAAFLFVTRSARDVSRKYHSCRQPPIGKRFGRLKVIRYVGANKWKQSLWECICKCGTTTVTEADSICRGSTRSCGCLTREHLTGRKSPGFIHGGSSVFLREGRSFRAMLERCTNPKNGSYENYGGRGIRVCERWREPNGLGFIHFMEDMGRRPKDKTLDRINPEGNYEPSNCRWATGKQQVNNRRCSYTPEELAELKKRADEVAEINTRIAAEDAELNPF